MEKKEWQKADRRFSYTDTVEKLFCFILKYDFQHVLIPTSLDLQHVSYQLSLHFLIFMIPRFVTIPVFPCLRIDECLGSCNVYTVILLNSA